MDPGLQLEMLKASGGAGHVTMTTGGESRLRGGRELDSVV